MAKKTLLSELTAKEMPAKKLKRVKKDRSWNAATKMYDETGEHKALLGQTRRCLESGRLKHMTPECWGDLIEAYKDDICMKIKDLT